ncbi:MAG: 8-amino-7-oxononanoate synthase [Candidatus Omnitrophota bacterium]|nr:8-amino-7-oxononanoate synthase [Candidatus Omnitrophota bacterium]
MVASEFKSDLNKLESAGILRKMRLVDGPQDASIVIDGKKVLNLCSNNYLGLANDKRLKDAAIRAIKKYGVGAGASRLVCGNMRLHQELEGKIADFKNAPRSLVFTSGYAANLGAITALVGHGDAVFADKLNHASLVDAVILSRAEFKRYPHKDMRALEVLLKESGAKKKLIVTDTVFSMDGDVAPLPAIVKLAGKYGAMSMVDEAHATGVLGKTGKGAVEHFHLEGKIDVQMGTLSKAIGSQGAFICGSDDLINFLINKSRQFIFTTALPVSLCAASIAAIDIIENESSLRKKLLANSDFFRNELKIMSFDIGESQTPIIPVITKDEKLTMKFSSELFKQGIFVQGIRPPTVPAGQSRLRVTIMANHRKKDLEMALKAFKKIGKSLGVI